MATPTRMTTQELNEALHAHFIRPEDRIDQAGAGAVYLTEVTAPNSNRRADAVHIGLWQSRGAGRIDVCELKVSRSDFRRELDNPAKAEAWWPYCDAFWIVAPSVEVAPPEELPDGWGLMVPGPRGRRFKKIVEPKKDEGAKHTLPLLLTLLKNTETTRTNALRQQAQKLRQEAYEREQQARRQGVARTSTGRRLEALDRLEELIGLKMDDYPWEGRITPETAAEGLKTFMQGQAAVEAARKDAEYVVRELDRVSKQAQDHAETLRKTLGIGR